MKPDQPGSQLLHTCKVALPEKGGVQIVANEVLRSVSESFASTLVSTRGNQRGTPPAIKNLSYSLKSPFFELKSLPITPGLILELWRRAKSADIFVAHYPFPLADLAVGLAPKRFTKIIVYWHSDIFEQRLLKKLLAPFTRIMLKRATAIVVASPKLIEHSEFLPHYQSKCVVIPFGYQPNLQVHTEDQGYYLCIGRHVKYKGITQLLQAIPNTNIKLKLVGTGPLLDQHIELAKRLNIEPRVEFIQNASDEHIVELISQCRALILPSVSPNEAFGLVQIEAMSLGKPVINTALPSAVPWVARDGKEAITVPPADPEKLTDAINRLEQDQSLRQQLAGNAFERWQNTFNLDKFHARTLELFTRIYDGNGSPSC